MISVEGGVEMSKVFKVNIKFSESVEIKHEVIAKNKDEAFELLFETSNDGWLTKSSDIRDIHYNLNSAISIEVIDDEKNTKYYEDYAKSFINK